MPGGKQSLLAPGQPWLSAKGGQQRHTGLFPLLVTHMDAGPDENPQESGICNLKAEPRAQIQLKTQTRFSREAVE